jgi:formylmethanofuran dehydrogenase subunit B
MIFGLDQCSCEAQLLGVNLAKHFNRMIIDQRRKLLEEVDKEADLWE